MSSPLKLHVFPKPEHTPYLSYYCQKLETFLRATSTPYTIVSTMPYSAPKGKLPYITLPEPSSGTMCDSQFIISHLVTASLSRDLGAGLSAAQKADTRAWVAYTDELIFPALVWHRASEPANWARLYEEVFVAQLPWGLRDLAAMYQKRQYTLTAWYNGLGRHSGEEIRGMLGEWVEGVEERLGGEDTREQLAYLMGGSEPTLADVAVYSLLVCALGTESNGFMNERVLGSGKLKRYVRILTEWWFPEYEGVLARTTTT